MLAASCPPSAKGSGGPPAPPPPRPRFSRYADPELQTAYARVVAALRTPTVAGVNVISEDEADTMSRYLIDAVRELPESAELQARARCALEPLVGAAATQAVGRLLLGVFAAVLGAGTALVAVRTLRR